MLYDGFNLRGIFTFVLLVAALATFGAQSGHASGLIVNSANNDLALEYNPLTGEFVKIFTFNPSLLQPEGITIDENEDTYISSSLTNEVLVFAGANGAFLGVFVTGGSGGLDFPTDVGFGHDGNFCVASFNSDEILRYNGSTGEFIDTFVTAGSGGLDGPSAFVFDSNGNLFVTSKNSNEVLEYNSLGQFVRALVPAGSGGLSAPSDLVFIDNMLLVASEATDEVLQYDRNSGNFVGAFIPAGFGGLDGPSCLSLGIQFGGNLHVCSQFTNSVLLYSRFTGAFISELVTSGSGGLDGPSSLAFKPGAIANTDSSNCSIASAGSIAGIPWLLFAPILFVFAMRIARQLRREH